MNYTNTINPKPCIYNCNTRIYWNNEENAYFEVFARKKHICPNRTNSKTSTYISKPNYYNKFTKQPKPKMSNSLELLQGSIVDVQKKYEILSDIVSSEANGKVHGSQSHIVAAVSANINSIISLIVYYIVSLGEREAVKKKFENLVRSQMTLQRNY